MRNFLYGLKLLFYNFRDSVVQSGRLPLVVSIKSQLSFFWKAKILSRLKLYQIPEENKEKTESNDSPVAPNTISHNLKGLSLIALQSFSGARPKKLFSIISLIEHIEKKTAKLLIIGPRAESEFYIAKSYGFKKENIRGLDLISYNRRVDLGDMHATPYADNSWNIVVMGWVLAYSENPQIACDEVLRISKNNAVIAIGVQYYPLSVDEVKNKLGYVPGAKKRITSTKEVLDMFGNHVNKVFFEHNIDESKTKESGDIMLVFSLKK